MSRTGQEPIISADSVSSTQGVIRTDSLVQISFMNRGGEVVTLAEYVRLARNTEMPDRELSEKSAVVTE